MTEHLVITDTQGRGYATRLKGTDLGIDSLSPGQARNLSVDVCSRYGVQAVGEYSCYLRTHLYSVLNPTFLKSNTIKFKVLEPKGEEKEALNLYLEAEKLSWARSKVGGPNLTKKELGFLKYLELVDKYPKSVYAPKALRAAIFVYVYSPQNREKVITICKRLIENYPNSYYWGSGFSHLIGTYEVLKDKEGAIKTMQELIKKHPNTKISERAEYWLEKIEKWEFK
jgi:tetratricopeptide (TPR) repeat protein